MNDTATTAQNTPVTIDVLANDSDADGDVLLLQAVATPTAQGGSVTNNGTSVTYTPAVNFAGTDTFTYTVSDNRGATADATVTVTVTAIGGRVTQNLLALYNFQGGSGTSVVDSSGVGSAVNLTIQNAAVTTWTATGLQLSGAGTALVSAGAATKITSAVKASGELTVEAWITPAAVTGGARSLVSMRDTATAHDVQLWNYDANVKARVRTSTTGLDGTVLTVTNKIKLQRHHVVLTRSAAGTATLYVDNVLAGTLAMGGDLSTWTDVKLALAAEEDSSKPFLGELHLVAIYDRALSADEVATNYVQGP
jgi:hypothetical protein